MTKRSLWSGVQNQAEDPTRSESDNNEEQFDLEDNEYNIDNGSRYNDEFGERGTSSRGRRVGQKRDQDPYYY